MTQSWPYEAPEPNGLTIEQIANIPPACSLTTDALQARIVEVRQTVLPKITRREPITGGYVYWLARSDENMRLASEFALFESRCCDFLSFGIGLHPGGTEISLRISGPRDGVTFWMLSGSRLNPAAAVDRVVGK